VVSRQQLVTDLDGKVLVLGEFSVIHFYPLLLVGFITQPESINSELL